MLDRLLPRVQTSPTHMDSEWRAHGSKVCQFLSGLSSPMCQWPIIYVGWRNGICTPDTLIRGLDAVLCPFVRNKTWLMLSESKKLISFLDKKNWLFFFKKILWISEWVYLMWWTFSVFIRFRWKIMMLSLTQQKFPSFIGPRGKQSLVDDVTLQLSFVRQ